MRNANRKTGTQKAIAGAITLVLATVVTPSQAIDIAEVPLFLMGGVEPNIMLMIDNSGSMSNIVPESPYNANVTYACPSGMRLSGTKTAELRVSYSGYPYIRWDGDDYDFGTSSSGSGSTGKTKKCFDPGADYNAALYADDYKNASGTANDYSYYGGSYLDATYKGNYLNWYFGANPTNNTYGSVAPDWGSNPSSSPIRKKPGTYQRLEIAKSASKDLIDSLEENYRVGLATYNGSTGGSLLERIDALSTTKKTAIKNDIDALNASGSTPLAETLSDIGRYFTQGYSGNLTLHPDQANESSKTISAIFNNHTIANNDTTAPIQYFCQKSFAVMLTDGRPQSDQAISSHLCDYDGDSGESCTNYDRKAGQEYESAGSDYLDDVAMALNEMDLRPDLSAPAGSGLDDKNNVVTYMIGFADDQVINDPLMQDTAENGGGQFLQAANADALIDAFNTIAAGIKKSAASSAALAANSTSIKDSTLLYQAQFESIDWSGHFSVFQLKSDGSPGIKYWDVADKLTREIHADGTSRNIFTRNGGSKVKLAVGVAPTGNLLAALDDGNAANTDGEKDKLNWLLGKHDKEVRNGGSFRNRERSLFDESGSPAGKQEWVLGDIVNSDPAYEKEEDYGYSSLPDGTDGQSTYAAFVSGKATRVPVIYVGANDGMLHAIHASKDGDGGKELFAYIPDGVYGRLSDLTKSSFTHKYLVDGPPTVSDAYLGGWKTILVAGLGGGGKSIYALDVTDPTAFGTANIKWEYTHSELGLTFSQPQIAAVKHAGVVKWVAIFGNGYNSTSGASSLFIVDLDSGTLIDKLDAGSGSSNGLSTPVLYDEDGDKVIDAVYAGDLQGDLWKFDLKATTWGAGAQIFDGSSSQPITAQPQTYKLADDKGTMIYFGTGMYLNEGDVNSITTQSFYAVRDDKDGATDSDDTAVVRDDLAVQTITSQFDATVTQEDGSTQKFGIRATSSNSVDSDNRGWMMDLVVDGLSASGERVVSTALIRHGRVIFVTVDPASEKCQPGGDSWLMELDALSGAAIEDSVFDFNNDDQFDDSDKIAGGKSASGVKSTVGITKTPIWIDSNDPGIAFKEMSGSTGGIMPVKNKGGNPPPTPPGGGGGGTFNRVYWMQIL